MARKSAKSDYKEDLLADLRNDLEYASEYLSAAYADSQEAFLVALRDVAEAQKGMGKVAEQTKLNRENLYRTLSKHGNPTLSTLSGVLDAVGLRIAVVEKNVEAVVPTPVMPTPAQKANTIRITDAIHVLGSASAWIGVANSAGSIEVSVTDESVGGQISDIPLIPLDLLAAQMQLEQEAAQG